eukprot:TRINITY_DN112286_c0_g1_i1.p1 TRINITY_DN112286_c0_g1~~TRINITY_DN112286_c0_g1_i1.p1  ORF type:complete len:175 (-),score=39.11 TRINITY_DN112286_c0_g1_i1:92-616(-)
MSSYFEAMKAKAKEAATAAQDAVQERVDTAKAGRKLVDEHGEAASVPILAKQAALVATVQDRSVKDQVAQVIKNYEDAAAQLRKASLQPKVEGITGYDEFIPLAEAYEQRLKAYKQVQQMINEDLKAFTMNAQEKDALTILNFKGGYEGAKTGLLSVGSCDTGKAGPSGYTNKS